MALRRRRSQSRRNAAFLNVPFDSRYEPLFIALIAALAALGRVPHCVLEVPEGQGRLQRIVGLMRRCSVSIHDLSRVQTSRVGEHRVPRFNMPFELGLTYAINLAGRHRFFLFEEKRHRLQASLSDMNGYDPQIHRGTGGLKREYGAADIFEGQLFRLTVGAATEYAGAIGLIH